jgi:hypothetical protein
MSETTGAPEDIGRDSEVAPGADAPPPAPSMRETMEAAYDRAQAADEAEPESDETPKPAAPERVRGADGKFTPKPAEAAAPAAPAPGEIPPPEGWGDKARVDWNRLPLSIRAEIAQRATPAADPVRGVINEFAQDIQAAGAQPEQMVRNLLNAERALRQDPVGSIQQLARMYGVDLSRFSAQPQQAQPSEAGQPQDPRDRELAEIKQQLQQVGQMTWQQQQSALQRQQAEASSEIQAFAKDRPHFETVRSDMSLLISQGRAKDLAEAYDMATWAHPQTRAALIQEQRQAEEAKRSAEQAERVARARKAGAVNVRSSVGASPAPARTLRETMEATWDALNA